jgi:hypothetical protein
MAPRKTAREVSIRVSLTEEDQRDDDYVCSENMETNESGTAYQQDADDDVTDRQICENDRGAPTTSVNLTMISSIRRKASKYTRRGSFRTGLSAKDIRLLKMILTIFVAFVACYLPITTVKALGKEAEWPVASVVSNLLIYLTTCINPLIYVAMSSEYRLAYKNLLTCHSDRNGNARNSSKNT